MATLPAALALWVWSAAGQTVLLDFYGDHCPPCRTMDPVVQKLSDQGYPVQRINVEQNPALANRFNVTGIPCFVMLVDGREVDRVVGQTTLARLEQMCQAAGPRGATTPVAPPAAPPAAPLAAPPTAPPGAAWPAAATADDNLIAATARLRIFDAKGSSCGTGTIVDARQGEALILTCGHIFRESLGKGRIEVDLFGPAATERLPGTLIAYDLQRDLGLVSIRTPGRLAVARIAPSGCRVGQGEPVVSVGCNNGDRPTAVRSRITDIDRVVGPPNFKVAGQPVEGRSGGGLFTDDGLVIGVCNAAYRGDNEGLFSALASIHAMLDKHELSFIYAEGRPTEIADRPGPVPASPPRGPAATDPPTMPRQMPAPPSAPPVDLAVRPAVALTETAARGTPAELAAVDEIRRRLQEGAEVVCVIRSRKDPNARAEVIHLDRVSPEFLGQIIAEAKPLGPAQLTSLETPRTGPPAASAGGLGRSARTSADSVPITPAVRTATPVPPVPVGRRLAPPPASRPIFAPLPAGG